ncbi:metal ABC transporter substrate-binding protein [Shimia ponticola]|uniref:metal ABC transporter substrate-binding protein n=1 Tax=Shimia ponticola TaxID=2582893 RepID=UPI0011BEA4AA|nr:metal ABC transporter substrate-binding protein [Shimia ponticola]
MAVAVLAATTGLAQDRPQIATVNYPLQYFAEQLAGDAADVLFPVPEDVDPSFWRPTISDISTIQGADLILLNGAGFATWIDRVSLPRSRVVNTSVAIEDQFIVTKSITHSHGDGGEHSHEGLAAYTWLDPTLASAQAEAVATAIAGKGLVPVEDVAERLIALQADLAALDARTAEALADVGDVAIIATHPRYQYLARRYDLNITSLEWEAGAMPSDAELAELADEAAQTGATVLIWEDTPPDAGFDAVTDLGLRNVVFSPLATANGDADFIASFDAYVTALSDALQAQPGN